MIQVEPYIRAIAANSRVLIMVLFEVLELDFKRVII
jgi:hypothetical protein